MPGPGGATIVCPSCHLEVAALPRCEACGSPLPPPRMEPHPADDHWPTGPELLEPLEPLSPDPAEPVDSGDDLAEFGEIEPEPEPDDELRDDVIDPGPPPPPPPAPPPPAPPAPPGPLDGLGERKDREWRGGELPAAPAQQGMFARLFFDFQFTGRMERPEYWKMFAIRAAIVLVCFLLAAQGLGSDMGGEMYPGLESEPYPGTGGEPAGEDALLALAAGIVMIWVAVAGLGESARRLHDTGKTGWWNLIVLIPYLGFLVLMFLLAQPGQPGDNDYGPAPGLPRAG